MVQQSSSVTVYSFRTYGITFESPQVSGHKATRSAIERLGAEPVPGTAQEVPAEAIDERGCYRRVNTGWGALD